MPGYAAFTGEVAQMMWRQRRLFAWVIGVYVALTIALVGISSQTTYTQLSEELRASGSSVFQGDWSELNQAGLLLLGGASGMFNAAPSDVQQVYAVLIGLLMWLTIVWLLRAVKAGKTPRLRDALYASGAPIVPTALIALIAVLQLLPLLVAVIGFGAANGAGLIAAGGVEAMLLWLVLGALGVMSLYWLTGTFIASVVVTLPGMWPLQAIRTAGDLVIGRRTRIVLRMAWLGGLIVLTWALVMLPVILVDTWIKGMIPAVAWLPVVPFMLAVMSAFSVVVTAVYVYLMYRRLVDDESTPA